ncbi:Hypothetical predicted protein [Olea europaea subsp. europaea]|uniref:Uncharacterized protein n=1 Tax=Olea europaea subsp. europaea TaxID=158383 RepID=A0A8S0SDF8_OLEEU|nr:Hypothetical predicted protein [Olea europaea subsp. europaea]
MPTPSIIDFAPPGPLAANGKLNQGGEVQVEVVSHVPVAVAVVGGAAVGCHHIGFLAAADDAFIVPPHVATQSRPVEKVL